MKCERSLELLTWYDSIIDILDGCNLCQDCGVKTVDEIRWENVGRRLVEAAWMCLWKIRCFGCFGWGEFSVGSFWLPPIRSFNMFEWVSSVRAITFHTNVRKALLVGGLNCVWENVFVFLLILYISHSHGFYRRNFVVDVEVAPHCTQGRQRT